jgi:MFS transporter, MFS domain-containing protein family, molybdate-anion transporter
MGRASLVNGIVATLAGILANWVVGQTDSFRAPFIFSGILLIVAFFAISANWDENHGTSGAGGTVAVAGGEFAKLRQALGLVRSGMSNVSLSLCVLTTG